MKSIKNNVIFTTSEKQINKLSDKYWGVYEWIEFFHLKTKVNIFNSINTLFDFDKQEFKKTKSKQLIEFKENKEEYEQYSLNILDHSNVSIWISKYRYNGNPNYYKWDGGEIGFIYVKKDWKYKERFIKLLNESCDLWTQYNNGYFDWVYDLSNEEVKQYYAERFQNGENKCNCKNCIISIGEMKEALNESEIDFYNNEYKYDKFGLEFISESLFGLNNV